MANCVNHPIKQALYTCRKCGNPICDRCSQEFGRFCSTQCAGSFQDLQGKIVNTGVRRTRFSLFGCLKTFIISLVLMAVIWVALVQLLGTSEPGAMWTEFKRMLRVAF